MHVTIRMTHSLHDQVRADITAPIGLRPSGSASSTGG